jgi:hypothetical protein
MEEFSIQHPETRTYIYEWIFHQALKREGVLSLRYEFIDVTLNGKDLGTYALEESFERRLVEHSGFREGPIVRFTEDLAWREGGADWWLNTNDASFYYSSEIDAFQTSRIMSDPTSYAQFVKAKNLLELSRSGNLRTSDVYDIQKLAKFFALGDLLGSYHIRNWNNMRFYYNPITSLLEPIGFDAFSGQKMRNLANQAPSTHVTAQHTKTLFDDPVFYGEYVKELRRVSEPSYLDTLLAELEDEIEHSLNILHREFPSFDYSADVYYQNQRFIQDMLDPVKGLQGYFHQASEDQIELELANIQAMTIEVLSVTYKDSIEFQPVKGTILPSAVLEDRPIEYQNVSFGLPADLDWSNEMKNDLKVNYRILGTERIMQDVVFPWSYLDTDFLEHDFVRQAPNVSTFDFLVVDEVAKEISIKPGSWELDQNLIIPEGYNVIARESTRLNLSNSAKILSYSPLQFLGSEDRPIVIQSTDSTGQGLVVMNAPEPSVLQHVTFQSLSNPSQNGWELTGAVTFYESPVSINDSLFVGSRAEDALNVVRSEFAIEDTVFVDSFSDAIDSDFSSGTVENSRFLSTGNDAIDTSGSVIEVSGVTIDGAGDKGLSAGERSHITASDIEIMNGWIGIASKDLSQVVVHNLNISDSEYGLAVYEKKSEFGPGSLEVNNLGMTTVTVPHLVEMQSSLVIDGQKIAADQENVYEQIYGTE